MKKEILALKPSEEVAISFLRLLKIWWSLGWRAALLVLPSVAILGGFVTVFPHKPGLGFSFLFLIAFFTGLFYLGLYLPFKWIIGLEYEDFRLDFNPPLLQKRRKILRVVGRYFVFTMLFAFALELIGIILLKIAVALNFEELLLRVIVYLIKILMSIYVLSFIVNRSYGDVRLSLLKRVPAPTQGE